MRRLESSDRSGDPSAFENPGSQQSGIGRRYFLPFVTSQCRHASSHRCCPRGSARRLGPIRSGVCHHPFPRSVIPMGHLNRQPHRLLPDRDDYSSVRSMGWVEEVLFFWVIGFLGSFTTFSTFSHDTLAFWSSGEGILAAVYAVGSLICGLGLLIAG